MRVLFSTVSSAGYMLPPLLGEEQVNCGPDWKDETGSDGRVISLATPSGEYNLAAIADKLPAEQKPDVVVCLIDASQHNLPRNLKTFKCPKVLLIADTHHLKSPLVGALRYLASEPFDRIVFLYDRHHASFFSGAGCRNLFWFPGLTFPHTDAAVREARSAVREPRIAFVGQSGKHHPRRPRLISALTDRGLPFSHQTYRQPEALKFYGSSLLGFNASLNGDLNVRIFEILAAGGALLTDRLAPESGLARLLADGRELITYGSAEELVERATQALAQPAETAAIGAAGASWFDTHFNEAWRREAFRALAIDGKPVPGFEFAPEEKTRVFFGGDMGRLLQSLIVYENVQEIHRTQETVCIALDPGVPADFAQMCTTLPRVQLGRGSDGSADLAVCGRAQVASAPTSPTARVWCWDVAAPDPELDRKFRSAGFTRSGTDVAVYNLTVPAAPVAPKADNAVVVAPGKPLPVGRKIYITFGGEVYDGPTSLLVLLAPKFGADEVWVYDDHWIMNEKREFYEQNRWLWEHHHKRGFGWYAWKPFILLDAMSKMKEGDVVLYTDADTFPVDDFSMLYDICAKDGGIMMFKAGGNVANRFTQRQWCKRDCFIVMNQDEEKYYNAEAGVARFMLFQKGRWRAQQFLMEWLTYCVNQTATTFDPSVLDTEVTGYVEHRTEQAIMSNLAHKYGLKLYREACELGNTFPEDKELFPQLFSQMNPWGNKTAPCVGSKFRNVT